MCSAQHCLRAVSFLRGCNVAHDMQLLQMLSLCDEQAMNEADQLRRAKRWAEDVPNESASTSAALDAFDPEVRSRIVEAANLGATMNIYKVGG
jgi:hypothetical protein